MTTPTAPSQLGEAASSFVSQGPHKLLGGAEDVARAAQAARSALEGKWGQMPAAGRERLMHALADLIEANSEELAELESLDNGKPVTLAGAVGVASSVAHLRYYAGWPTKIEG